LSRADQCHFDAAPPSVHTIATMSHPLPPESEENQPPPLPDLNQALLDEAGLAELLSDIEACTEVTEIIPKQAAEGYVAENATLTLADARRMLAARAVRAVQIRYRYDGVDWWDTLMVLPEGYRLVRIRHDFGGAG
jgi:hypothetical protein